MRALLLCWAITSCAAGSASGPTTTRESASPEESGVDDATTIDLGTVAQPTVPPVLIGAPPAGLAVVGSSVEQAVLLVDGLESVSGRGDAAVGAFAAAGLPILAGSGVSVTTDPADLVGLPWTYVWFMTQTPSAVGLKGTMRLFGLAVTADGAAADQIADATVVGLQDALADTDPRSQLLATIVAESARRTRGVELATLEPDTELFVDPVIAAMVVTAVERMIVGTLLERADYAGTEPPVASSTAWRRPTVDASDCSSAAANWSAYFGSKGIGGLGGLADLAPKGGRLQKVLNGPLSAVYDRAVGSGANVVGEAVGSIGAAMNVLALAGALGARTAAAALDAPLKRTKSTTSDGESGRVTFIVGSKMNPDVANCALLLLTAVGSNSLLPADGPSADIEVMVEGRQGFAGAGDYMYFGGGPGRKELPTTKGTTGSEGESLGKVRFDVQGRAQPLPIPLSAPGYQRPFSLFAEARLSPTGMTEILKTLANGFLCGLKPGIGCADSAADIAGQFHWDLGEFPFEITDWQRGLVVDVTVSFKETDQHSGLLEVTEFSLVVDDLLLVPLTSDATDFAEVVTPQLVNATNNAIWTGGEWVNSSEMTVAAVVKPPADPSKTATVDVAITLDGGVAFPWDGDPPYFGWELGGTFGRWEDLGATRPLTFPSEGGTVSYSVSGGSATGDVQEFVVTVTLHAR